jgi:hypothetical protein
MTVGWSPKVYVPGLVQVAIGIGLIAVGATIPNPDLSRAGIGVITAGVATFGLGRVASPGEVLVNHGEPSDAGLPLKEGSSSLA